MLLSSIYFTLGLALLLFSGDVLMRASLRFAVLLGVRPLTAGLTITAFATSAPEAMIAIDAAAQDLTDIVLGNVIGSNIANILLVLGLPALFISLPTDVPMIRRQTIIVLATSLLLLTMAYIGEINFWTGILFLLLILAWLIRSLYEGRHIITPETGAYSVDGQPVDEQPAWLTMGTLVFSIGGLWLGAHLTITGAEDISALWGISEAVVGLTLLAVGTSLPELATSVMAVWRRQADIALGNILGSNVFNILFVLGVASLITHIEIPRIFLWLDLPVMLGAILVLMPFALMHRPLSRPIGAGFLAIYGLYVWSLYAFRPEMI